MQCNAMPSMQMQMPSNAMQCLPDQTDVAIT